MPTAIAATADRAEGLPQWARLALGCAAFLFFMGQLTLTFLNRNMWPLSAHNFFAFVPPEPVPTLAFRVGDGAGHWTGLEPVGRGMPIEFFRANQMTARLAIGGSPSQGIALCELMLRQVGAAGRIGFDETMRPIALAAGFVPKELTLLVLTRRYERARPEMRGDLVTAVPVVECSASGGSGDAG